MGRQRVEQREVDAFGLVDCTRRDLPTLAQCARCPDLVGALVDVDERVIAVRCRVTPTEPDEGAEGAT